MVLAKPATNVTSAIAVPRECENQVAMTAKAGSYKIAAPKKPFSAMIAMNSGKEPTCDHKMIMTVAPMEPKVISSRAPCRSSQ